MDSRDGLTGLLRGSAAAGLRRDLNALDFTLLVLGAEIGADVYIVASLGAGYLGPAQMAAWAVAGVMAALIVLAFMQCAVIYPEVGGTYAYVRHAYGSLAGFTAGWSLYLGEVVLLPVFPTAFLNYVTYFVPGLGEPARLSIIVGLVACVTVVNIVGVRASGRLNDVLTLAKLIPLLVLIGAGIATAVARPGLVSQRLEPFAPLGWGGFGPAVILIFLAYAGFELAVLPASEIQEPRKTMPRGLLTAVSICTLVYLLTTFATTVAVPWQDAARSSHPLADALDSLTRELGWAGLPSGVLMSLGGLVSISAAFDVYTLSVARLSYAMAADGFLPRPFAWVSPRFGTPVVALVVQGIFGIAAGRVLELSRLIDAGMFLIGLCYAATSLAAIRLVSRHPDQSLRVPALRVLLALGGAAGLYLALQAPVGLKLTGLAVVGLGVGLYCARAAVVRIIRVGQARR
ncbi:MAG TPA: APC family permease [Chloroflexota bacterium]|nr:APC family permease [Chloroflexota bacterium]